MKKLRFVGDVHGRFNDYYNRIVGCNQTIQVGDMALGFPMYPKFPDKVLNLEGNHKFIRGNHDNPEVCNNNPLYLGDYGYIEEFELFYVSGADSLDKEFRTIGIDWWENEQLAYTVFENEVFPLYQKVKPKIVVTHDCPLVATQAIYNFIYKHNLTVLALDEMMFMHKPEKWIFGHHHKWLNFTTCDVEFIGLKELGTYDYSF